MNCSKLCGPRISIRRALYLAAAQIILALIIANSSGPEQTDNAADHGLDGQIVSPVGAG